MEAKIKDKGKQGVKVNSSPAIKAINEIIH
jgi:hypothetical protein